MKMQDFIITIALGTAILLAAQSTSAASARAGKPNTASAMKTRETQITHGAGGRILTDVGAWSPDSEWVVFDTRPDAAGEVFAGDTIEMVNIRTHDVRVLYRSKRGAHCGVVTHHPHEPKVVFILGPENPTPDWSYGPAHRQGVIVDVTRPGEKTNLDARDVTPPFTPGALRGGSHVHVWDAAGEWVSFTYEDHVLGAFSEETSDHEINLRNVAVSVPGRPVRVQHDHPRNHDGEYFTVLVTRTVANPKPGSDEIKRAFEEGWVGTNGYLRPDGTRQRRALAFQGNVVTPAGKTVSEVFIVDLPDDPTVPGDGPLEGTATRRPRPPRGTVQRRLTFTADRPYPGIQGPRHWLRCSPDGQRIAFLMKDSNGIVQIWTISPNGGPPHQLTRNPWSIGSAFTWSSDGQYISHIMDRSVCVTDSNTGETFRLTEPTPEAVSPRPEACVFSPDGKKIAYVRRVPLDVGKRSTPEGHLANAAADPAAPPLNNQVFVVFLE